MSGNIEDQTTPEQLKEQIRVLSDSLKAAFDKIQELDERISAVDQNSIDLADEVRRELINDIQDCQHKIGNVEDDVRRLDRQP